MQSKKGDPFKPDTPQEHNNKPPPPPTYFPKGSQITYTPQISTSSSLSPSPTLHPLPKLNPQDRNKTHPPLKAPTGFLTGNGVAPSRNIVELWKLRSGAERSWSAVEGLANARMRSAGVRMRDAMVVFCIAEQDEVVN
ncbi:hypothetical protein HYALB_00010335 [Hymenoscyphus albidus]|uniref:Uncharacterized protein n=1 Tax=Hymenoscyphus albidus TaxID=595503 RepID=A0A9N9LLR7_9HELO|nr:hypothetical protein HYALB_00010335 [Hymenoscyphus albidus]